MDLSIVIVSWNTREVLRGCLASVFRETRDVDFEVIVVDNAGSDGTLEMLAADFPAVRVLANPANRGFAAANNQGIALARGRFVLLLNSDTIVLDGALQRAVRAAEAAPGAGVVGCRLLNADGSLQPSAFQAPSLSNLLLTLLHLPGLFPRSRWLGKERMTWWPHDDTREVEVAVGAFMLARREAIAQVGGMDEQFFMYGEEVDWCLRMKRAGWCVLFTAEAEIIHLGGASSQLVGDVMFLQNHGSVLLLVRKHRSRPYYLAYLGLTVLLLAARSLEWRMLELLPSRREVAGANSRRFGEALGKLLRGGPEALCRRPALPDAAPRPASEGLDQAG